MTDPKPVGRPKNAEVDLKLKTAALRLVRERGYDRVSIIDLIKAAGVSRQSLYNRWPSKADLMLAALHHDAGLQVRAPDPAGHGSYRFALQKFLEEIFRHLEQDGRILRSLIASAQEDAEFQKMLRTTFVHPREAIVTDLLMQAQAAGELPANRDVAMLSSFAHGAFWYRLLNGEPLGAEEAERIATAIFAA